MPIWPPICPYVDTASDVDDCSPINISATVKRFTNSTRRSRDNRANQTKPVFKFPLRPTNVPLINPGRFGLSVHGCQPISVGGGRIMHTDEAAVRDLSAALRDEKVIPHGGRSLGMPEGLNYAVITEIVRGIVNLASSNKRPGKESSAWQMAIIDCLHRAQPFPIDSYNLVIRRKRCKYRLLWQSINNLTVMMSIIHLYFTIKW